MAVSSFPVLLGGISIVALVSGIQPSGSLAAGFLLASLFLLAVYVLLMLTQSSVAKSTGTALVFGIALWLVFNFLFAFLAFFLLVLLGQSPSSRGPYEALAIILLLDPSVLYQLLVAAATPGSNLGPTSVVPAGAVGASTLVGAAVFWIAGVFLLSYWVFARKAAT